LIFFDRIFLELEVALKNEGSMVVIAYNFGSFLILFLEVARIRLANLLE
jgi:hypothetical protein